ncbi:hypothetical protein J27TS7_43400 [Paenibacillus dendritiformis]|nr:hypothetical protein J27TS7_43400 [Paenibacillus dendritiformis]
MDQRLTYPLGAKSVAPLKTRCAVVWAGLFAFYPTILRSVLGAFFPSSLPYEHSPIRSERAHF